MRVISKTLLLIVAGGFVSLSAAAQGNAGASGSEMHKSFQEFRKGMLSDFKDFRQRLLDQYADFLNGEWHEYESIRGDVRDKTPKPKAVPTVNGDRAGKQPDSNPTEKKQPVVKTQEKPDNRSILSPESATQSKPTLVDADAFDFYGIPLTLPKVDYNIRHNLATTKDYGSNWNSLKEKGVASKVIPDLKRIADEMNLNDYLLFRLTESYVNGKFADTDASSRFSLVHYLLANMGYDVRIAVTTSGTPLLLLPFKERVFARTYMKIGNERYYAFAPENSDLEAMSGEGILTCHLPSDGNLGEKFELRLSGLNIPVKPKSFKLEYGPLCLSGDVNENLMPILYHYPQMPVEDFAISEISPELRSKLISQVKTQLSGMQGDEKVEALLKFMHNVFEYATDEDNHGFEKPYFLEETLFYPKNDCEDRAIFYTWLLWNALGREAQLITFPGHESATVVMEKPVEGTSYNFDGKKYYVSDPTYIGSSTGMVMPTYRGLEPEIDYTYRR